MAKSCPCRDLTLWDAQSCCSKVQKSHSCQQSHSHCAYNTLFLPIFHRGRPPSQPFIRITNRPYSPPWQQVSVQSKHRSSLPAATICCCRCSQFINKHSKLRQTGSGQASWQLWEWEHWEHSSTVRHYLLSSCRM